MYIIQAGYHWFHKDGFALKRPHGYTGLQLILTQTPAKIEVLGKETIVEKNTAIVMDFQTPHALYSYGGDYMDDWFRFGLSKDEQQLMETLEIPMNTFIALGDDHTVEALIYACCAAEPLQGVHKAETQHHILLALFHYLSDCAGKKVGTSNAKLYRQELVRLRRAIYKNPQFPWALDQMAADLNLSVSYFQRLYRSCFGVSCMADVTASRMQNAQHLLIHSDKLIQEIAELCGYHSYENFCRQFRKYACYPPSEYRRLHCESEQHQ